ncbi:hypothetical protein F5Y02DRAFT_218248 [Annulohypoxylon stygium]|nr:hypothetical protein F5Y02DRAFT_218248 [Annulohypoxylon stygium]
MSGCVRLRTRPNSPNWSNPLLQANSNHLISLRYQSLAPKVRHSNARSIHLVLLVVLVVLVNSIHRIISGINDKRERFHKTVLTPLQHRLLVLHDQSLVLEHPFLVPDDLVLVIQHVALRLEDIRHGQHQVLQLLASAVELQDLPAVHPAVRFLGRRVGVPEALPDCLKHALEDADGVHTAAAARWGRYVTGRDRGARVRSSVVGSAGRPGVGAVGVGTELTMLARGDHFSHEAGYTRIGDNGGDGLDCCGGDVADYPVGDNGGDVSDLVICNDVLLHHMLIGRCVSSSSMSMSRSRSRVHTGVRDRVSRDLHRRSGRPSRD